MDLSIGTKERIWINVGAIAGFTFFNYRRLQSKDSELHDYFQSYGILIAYLLFVFTFVWINVESVLSCFSYAMSVKRKGIVPIASPPQICAFLGFSIGFVATRIFAKVMLISVKLVTDKDFNPVIYDMYQWTPNNAPLDLLPGSAFSILWSPCAFILTGMIVTSNIIRNMYRPGGKFNEAKIIEIKKKKM